MFHELFKQTHKESKVSIVIETLKNRHDYLCLSPNILLTYLHCIKIKYLRSTMMQDRLTNLALLHIEREFVNEVLAENMERMINSFGEVKGRRQFFF